MKAFSNMTRAYTLAACVQQGYLFIMCTLWRDVVVIPNKIFRPPLSEGYWEWYLAREEAPYENLAIAVDLSLGTIMAIVMLLGFFYSLGNQTYRSVLGKRCVFTVAGIGGALAVAAFLYGNIFGEPFYLFLGALPFEALSLSILTLAFLYRRTVKRGANISKN